MFSPNPEMLVVCSGKGSGENEMVVMGNVFFFEHSSAGRREEDAMGCGSWTQSPFTVFMLLKLFSCC